jgi:hypothetical protein
LVEAILEENILEEDREAPGDVFQIHGRLIIVSLLFLR